MATAAEIQEQLGGTLSVEEAPDTQPRDEKGRFASLDTALDDPEAPAETVETPETPPAEPEAKAEGEAPAETPEVVEGAEQVPPEDIPQVEDWKFTTQRRGETIEVAIPGAKFLKGHGVLIPDTEEAQAIFRQAMNKAAIYDHKAQQLMEAREQLQSGVTRHQLENAAMVEQFQKLLSPEFHAAALGVEVKDLPPRYLAELDRVMVALERKQVELERQLGSRVVGAPDGAGETMQVAEQLDEAFDEIVARVAPNISAEHLAQLSEAIPQYTNAFVERGSRGVTVNRAQMERFITDWIPKRVAPTPPKTEAKPRPAVQNAARVKDRIETPPAAGGAPKSPVAAPAPKPRSDDGPFTSREDAQRYWG